MKITKMKEMERNTWRVAHDIALIDDAPVLSDYIRAFVTTEEDAGFF